MGFELSSILDNIGLSVKFSRDFDEHRASDSISNWVCYNGLLFLKLSFNWTLYEYTLKWDKSYLTSICCPLEPVFVLGPFHAVLLELS